MPPELPADPVVAEFESRLLDALENPHDIDLATVQDCEQLLSAAGLPPARYEQALNLLAAVLYWRPDLVENGTVDALQELLTSPSLPAATYTRAARILDFLLITPAAPQAIALLLALLRQSGRPFAVYDSLLASLAYAASWAMAQLDLTALVSLAEGEHLAGARERLLHQVIEPALFADPAAVTPSLFARLSRLYAGHPSFKYCRYYLAAHRAVAGEVRTTAAAAIAGPLPLHDVIARRLGTGAPSLLVVQNIADRQGDEIIRIGPLLDALLGCNAQLAVVLLTGREYLYAHSRLTPVAITDQNRSQALLRGTFDAVINFFEPGVPEMNYDQELERRIQAHVRRRPPFLYLAADKGWNHFLYQRLDIQARQYAETLGLHRQRVDNVYETTFRLISELGLTLRLGEEPPPADSVLAGLPCPTAEAAWSALLRANTTARPVALVGPFGGAEPLKGYVERQADALAAQLRTLIAEGFYVVLLPNGTPWGTAAHAERVVRRLTPAEQQQVAIAPDPAAGTGQVTFEHNGSHSVPYASYQMRLLTYYIRFADLVVTVEGWMVHAAYALGKRYRVLMLPYSHVGWLPYGRTSSQDITRNASQIPAFPDDSRVSSTGERQTVMDGPAPLPEQPRKIILLYLLRSLGGGGAARAVPLLQWALGSEDRDVRLAAAESLGTYNGPAIDADLQALLHDPAHAVRAAAAGTLLERPADSPSGTTTAPRELLLAHRWIGQEERQWGQVVMLREAARSALETAAQDDDPVVRREAAQVLALLDRQRMLRMKRAAAPRRPKVLKTMLGPLSSWLPVGTGNLMVRVVSLLAVLPRRPSQRGESLPAGPTVLILTPVKNAADCLPGYWQRLGHLTYPHGLISVGLLESDSSDATWLQIQRRLPTLRREFRRVGVWKRDFGYHIPPGVPRWRPEIQIQRRTVLAKSRNHLLFHALNDEAWVLWLDVDVIAYPPDLIERLIATGKDVVQPHCVLAYGGKTFDLNGWRDHGRLHLDDLREEGDLVELDAVGGTVLLVRADLHRDGLIFPPFLYGRANSRVRNGRRPEIAGDLEGEIETEGLGIMARELGASCWGMPGLEVLHRRK